MAEIVVHLSDKSETVLGWMVRTWVFFSVQQQKKNLSLCVLEDATKEYKQASLLTSNRLLDMSGSISEPTMLTKAKMRKTSFPMKRCSVIKTWEEKN